MIDLQSWQVPPIFELLRKLGNMDPADYRRTYNLGIGMILIVPESGIGKAERLLKKIGETYYRIGHVARQRRGRGQVEYL